MHQDDSNSKDWTGHERRGIDGMTLRLMAETRAMLEKHEQVELERDAVMEERIQSIDERIDYMSRQIEGLQASMTSFIDKAPDEIVEKIEILIDEAFPDDPEFPDATPREKRKLHRRYHANLIKDAIALIQAKKEIRKNIIDRLIEKAVDQSVVIIGLGVLAYLQLAPK